MPDLSGSMARRGQEQQQPPSQSETVPQGEAGQRQGENPLIQMITSIDQALTKVAQVVGKTSLEHGSALNALGEQFRQVISDFIDKQKGGQRQAPPSQAPSETGGRQAQQAF